jgi:hypothetical protein
VRHIFTAFFVLTVAVPGAERSFPIRHAEGDRARQELATLVRAELEIRDLQLDNEQSALRVAGSEAQMTAAEWLLAEIDKPAARVGAEAHASRVYRIDGVADGALRVFYLKGGRTQQDIQETAVAMQLVDIRRLFIYQNGGIVVRGTREQLEAAEWVWLTIESDGAGGAAELRMKLYGEDHVVRAYRMPAEWSSQEFNEAAMLLRGIVEPRRLSTYGRTKTILARTDEARISAASWLAAEVLRAPSKGLAISAPFRMADAHGESVVKVVRMPAEKYDYEGLQRLAASVRVQTKMNRLFILRGPRMIALRGTEAQMARAEKMLQELQ